MGHKAKDVHVLMLCLTLGACLLPELEKVVCILGAPNN